MDFFQNTNTNAVKLLMMCIGKELHESFYGGTRREIYPLHFPVFQFLRTRTTTIRANYLQTCFQTQIPDWETMLVDAMFFGTSDPFGGLHSQELYKEAIRAALRSMEWQLPPPYTTSSSGSQDSDLSTDVYPADSANESADSTS